ncbi:hypothetical protein HMPREF9420_0484 [Segatella salivae DSM 15606]|uniref:Uncharacterized protein n=1 Tax=Segatella salivae DSM 15606 TaxID=888832 RepID=E6MLW7_9BACT|nr:hypothetical protein HMPREF9420_0484 [Segatella salivae DSM 15606]
MLVYQQLAVGQIGVKLGDVGVFVGDITCAAEVVGVIEENVLGVGGICWDITIARLGIIRVLGLLPLNRRAGNISLFIELRSLHPTFGHGVVAQVPDNVVITTVGVVGICRCPLHRRNTRQRAERLIILLTLFLYLHHACSIIFLTSRNIIATDTIDIAELAYTRFA